MTWLAAALVLALAACATKPVTPPPTELSPASKARFDGWVAACERSGYPFDTAEGQECFLRLAKQWRELSTPTMPPRGGRSVTCRRVADTVVCDEY